ncbi:MAG: HPr family phosphocarrier protein [Ghiorsea sp.]
MIGLKVVIQNKLGLHARASAKFVSLASQFPCYIGIQNGKLEVNGKSIMGIMMLAAAQGTEVTLIADGEQEQEAVYALEALINQYFGESS